MGFEGYLVVPAPLVMPSHSPFPLFTYYKQNKKNKRRDNIHLIEELHHLHDLRFKR